MNQVSVARRVAYTFPELRCTFGNRSIVPDIAVLRWEHIRFDQNGEPIDDVLMPPDWMIEILSPARSANRVMGNILHCLNYGCELGWLIDLEDRSVLVFQPRRQPELLYEADLLPVMAGIELNLSVGQLFSWLKMQHE